MIGFADLARSIADKWKGLHADEKAVYEAKAAIEKGKYREHVFEWDRSRETEEDGDIFRRIGVAQEDDDSPLPVAESFEKSTATTFQHNRDSLSDLLMGNISQLNILSQMAQDDVPRYLSLTKHTLNMARASLSLPLFASLPIPPSASFISDQYIRDQFQAEPFINHGSQADDSYQDFNAVHQLSQIDHYDFTSQFVYTKDFP